jgi:hypothetical protein
MKPNTRQAMAQLIKTINENVPMELSEDEICRDKDDCRSCSIKLVEYLSGEIENWEYRLQQGDVPDFKDLSRLTRAASKIHTALKKNGLITEA